jgi:hypothetical protein
MVTNRSKGDRYRPIVTVTKERNGTPTKVIISGQEYALIHKDYINGRKGQKK